MGQRDPLLLAALFIVGWAISAPIGFDKQDEPFPYTAYPMYAHVTPQRASFFVLHVVDESGNATRIITHEAFDPEHAMLQGPADRAMRTIYFSYRGGCPTVQVDGWERCDGDPDGFRLPADVTAAWDRSARGRLGLEQSPSAIVFVVESMFTDAQRRAADGGVHSDPLFWVDPADGVVRPGAPGGAT